MGPWACTWNAALQHRKLADLTAQASHTGSREVVLEAEICKGHMESHGGRIRTEYDRRRQRAVGPQSDETRSISQDPPRSWLTHEHRTDHLVSAAVRHGAAGRARGAGGDPTGLALSGAVASHVETIFFELHDVILYLSDLLALLAIALGG